MSAKLETPPYVPEEGTGELLRSKPEIPYPVEPYGANMQGLEATLGRESGFKLKVKGVNKFLGFGPEKHLHLSHDYPKMVEVSGGLVERLKEAQATLNREDKSEVSFKTSWDEAARTLEHSGVVESEGKAEGRELGVGVEVENPDFIVWHTHPFGPENPQKWLPTFGRRDVASFVTNPSVLGMGVINWKGEVHFALKSRNTPLRKGLAALRRAKITRRLKRESRRPGGAYELYGHIETLLNLFNEDRIVYYHGRIEQRNGEEVLRLWRFNGEEKQIERMLSHRASPAPSK